MNLDQLLSIIRAALNILGGTLVAKGVTDSTQWEAIVGGVLALAAVIWGVVKHKTQPAKGTSETS